MAAVNIHFQPVQYSDVLNGQLTINDLFKNLLFEAANHRQIITQLQNYHSDEDGAPIVPGFDITHINFNKASGTGQLRFTYSVDYTFACADRRSATKHIETSNFTLDTETETLTLFIHDKISRDTVDEF